MRVARSRRLVAGGYPLASVSNDILQTVLCIRNAIDPPRDGQKIEATIGFGDSANPFAEPDSFFGTSGIQLFRVNIPVPADPAVPVTGETRTGSESNGWELLLDPHKASPFVYAPRLLTSGRLDPIRTNEAW